MIWCLSCGSSSMLTDRSDMETAAEAVSVTSSTSTPLPSSSGTSSLCVCSLLRSDRSMVHLRYTHTPTNWNRDIITELECHTTQIFWPITLQVISEQVDRGARSWQATCIHPNYNTIMTTMAHWTTRALYLPMKSSFLPASLSQTVMSTKPPCSS